MGFETLVKILLGKAFVFNLNRGLAFNLNAFGVKLCKIFATNYEENVSLYMDFVCLF